MKEIQNNFRSNFENEKNLEFYSLENPCPLNESQLNVYLDIIANNKLDAYLLPINITISDEYCVDDLTDALDVMFEMHPILKMRVTDEFDVPCLVEGRMPTVTIESNVDDEFGHDFLNKPFDITDSLSRFLILKNDETYELFGVFHHLIFDGLSRSVFEQDLINILKGNSINVDESFIEASNFNAQLEEMDEFDAAKSFYETMLADSDEAGELLSSVSTDGHGNYTIDLEADITDFVEKYGISKNVLFTSVFAYTLSRFAGDDKVVFNTLENGRDRFDCFDSIGMFVNTLPLLVDCKNQDIASFISQVSDLIRGVRKHNIYPYRLLANEYDINSPASFQYIPDWFVTDELTYTKNNFKNIISEGIAGDRNDLISPFSADVTKNGDKYTLNIIYSDEFSKELVSNFGETFKLILHDFIKVDELSQIKYISSSDIELLDNLNKTETPLKYEGIMDAFNDNLANNPNNKLVSYNDVSYSYGEGAFIASRIAESLTDLGVESQDCVGFLLPRSELYMFSVLGILSLGAVYVPLDDKHPDERVNFIVNDSGAKVVIVNDETYSRAQDLTGNFNILNISDIINGDNGSLDNLPVSYGELACILYTSGTTGIPKGVKVTSKSILNLSHNYADKNNMSVGDVCGLYASVGFDAASQAICQTVYAGATLSVIPEDIRLNIEKLNEYMINQNINHVMMTTPVGKLFMENADNELLDVLIVGGEKLGDFVNHNDYKLIDGYGPTETFAFITSIDNTLKIDSSSIGMINDNTKVYILDNEGRRVPVGAVGELCISGYQVADGYLNREEETTKAFVNNTYEDNPDYGVLYRSGDMVRVLPDGSLGIVGRRDSQVKIRGNRVELSEIESVIREMEYINDVTVQTFKNNSNNELVAYVVLNNELDKEWDDIKKDICNYVAESKPEYMVPSYVICLDKIPLNVNGKVDKRALPEIDIDSLSVEYAAPTNETEKIIVDAFEEVFNRERISIYDDFTHLGGDSLTAISLLSYLSDLNLSAGDILSLRTPHAIANSVNEVSLDLDIYSLDSGCPLNEPQLNVYLDIMANDKKDSYLIPFSMNIPSKHNMEDIKSTLDVMLDVHPILQMCVSDDFDVPYLVKGSKPSIIVETDVDDEFLTKPFDLHDSLCRFLIVDNDDNFVLFAVFHHIIFDAVSAEVFKRDLYAALDGKVVEMDDSFLKVSAFNQQIAESSDYAEAEEFYESMLADIDETSELFDSVLADGPGSISHDLDLDKDLFASFLDKHNISENVLFSGVFAYTLSRFVASEKVFFNLVENGRGRFRNYDSIGMFVNTLPVVMDCKNQDISSFMDYMSDRVYGVMRYNYYPFRLLANKYDLKSDILFQFLPEWIKETNDSDKNIIDDDYDLINKMDDLNSEFTAEVIQKGNDYVLNVTYSEKYSRDFINHFIESYKFILNDMLSVDELCDINYISSDDLNFLDNINNNEYDLIYDDILDAFNDNLSKYPDNKLVSYEDKSYSYGEGAFIAQRIAKSLTDLGVESQDCVGFLVPRSELYMFSVLGILSCGAVYVPLDDNHPDERLKFILEDSGCNAVIVNDKTYERLSNLEYDGAVLNISDIINDNTDSLSCLPVVYDDLACILYTSGTTGIPKGVKITRKSLVNYIGYYVKKSGISYDDVFALYASIGFDVGAIKSIFVPIYSGACLDIIPKDARLDMNKLNEHFNNHNVTHAHLPTQIAKLFINEVDNHSLEVLCTGGEKLGKIDYSCDYLFVDSYGPTEACVSVTAIKESDKVDPSSIGFLLDNLKAYVLDDEFRRVPIGAVGELYLSGIQLADGYLNRDEETTKAFLNNPFDDEKEFEVMYRSGDMVRVLPDGSLGIVGRRDKQVKIRGNRIELSEVELVIREIDYVNDVTVQTVKHGTNNELVAYVSISKDMNENELRDSVREYVSKNKPDFMVPSYVVGLDEIPLNINGKVDKRALPEIDLGGLHVEYVAATNDTEQLIIDAFESVFNQENIGLFDDFVRLGGDSISAIRVITLLQKNGVSCTARDILNYKTPYLIAQNLEEFEEEISYDAIQGEIGLLPIQSYFFDQNNKNEFTQQFILESKTKLDINVLQDAFDELSNVHDMLRVVYKSDDDGNPIQEILPLDTRVCEIKEHTITDLNKEFNILFIESIRSLDIHNNLIDINLIHYHDKDYVLFNIHHMIIDGVSWNILLVDLTYIYYRLVKGKNTDLLRPYPYKNWIEDVKKLAYDISEEEKEHWFEVNALLNDSNIKGKTNIYAFNVDIDFDRNNLLMLTEEEYWALAISRAYKKTYDEDVIFNRESHGRDDTISNLNRTIGWFTSQYPVPVDVSEDNDGISLIKDVYNLKTAFKDINNLGLNYASLIYTTGELEYKHCPVTFNFLSNEFVFENQMFKSINEYLSSNEEISIDTYDSDFYGISLNVTHSEGMYLVAGAYAMGTYIGDKYSEFVENIKKELKFISNYKFEDTIACCLSEPQMGIYLDEKVNDKGIAYSTSSTVECESTKSVEEIENAIKCLIDKHPILKGRILDDVDMPLYVCDSYPTIEIIDSADTSNLVKPFDLKDNLARFYIINTSEQKSIFFDIHHIISDATTLSVIINDLNDALNDKLDNTVDLGFVYSSYDFFDSKFQSNYDSAHEFFARNFSEIDDIQTLLSDVEGSDGSIILPIRGFKNELEEFAHENGITVGNLLYAVFAYTYSRFTGGDKVYFNIMEHGRHDNYVQDAVGIFIRTIPLIVDCTNAPINEFLSNVSDLVLDSMTNSIYPFRLLASEFNLNNNIFFEYNADLNDTSFIGNEMICTDYALDTVGEFSCIANDLEDGYSITINHSDKYSQETAKRFAYTFKEILTQILDKTNLSEIDYISCEDIKILDEFNETDYQFEYNDILEAFNDNLSKYPDNKLVTYKDASYTYSQGAFIANKLAEKLVDLGIKPQDNVAFLTERSEHYMFSILGILSTGAVYVPLDDKHPDDRIKFILDDTDSKVIIASDETYERAKELSDATILNISPIVKEDIGKLDSLPVVYGNLACMLYTSGTTGVPKGVKVTRKSVINVCESYINSYNLDNNDVYALFSGIGFDVSSFVINVVMCAGACLSVVPEDIRLNMHELNNYFINQNVTHAFITTQVGKLFMQSVDETSLDVLLVAGEKLGEFESPENYTLVDAYGPTEAFAFVTSICNSDKLDYSSVGFCNSNVKAYVMDDEFRRVPIGAAGELYLAGHQVADGYLNREEETQKAFLDNPFDDGDYGVLYRTGDIVKVMSDGSLGIVGRRDSQVKIRGNRVELSEIEAVIREIEQVEDVTVQTVKQGTNSELIAYVVGNEEENALKEFVCDYVGDLKPDYMVPSFVVKLDEIPLNVNGKVDKRALPEVNMSSLRAEYLAPSTKDEKLIVEAFEKVFGQKRVSLNDDFVRMGGDSLTAIKLVSYLEGYNLTVADILSLRTPLAIAENIREFDFDFDMYSLENGCPLTESQLNIYLDIIANKKTDSYLIPLNIAIPDKYDVESLVDAIEKMLIVHPILNMRISDEFDVPYLIKGTNPSITIESDVSDEFGREWISKPFDLDENLCKFLILKNDDIYYLFAVFHHLIFDGLSSSVFEHDLFKILNHEFIELDETFLKVSAFNKQITETNEFNDAGLFYESMLADIDESGVLLDNVCPDGPGNYILDLDTDINEFLDKTEVSENVLFTSVFAYTLSRFMGDENVFFNIVENGRDRFNNFNSIGMFVNTLPILVNCKNQNIDSFIDYMSDVVYGAIGYNYYPFRLLASQYDINSDILFQFKPDWFIKGDVTYDENTFDKRVKNEIIQDMTDFIANLEVDVVQKADQYSLEITYSDKYSKEFIERLAESFKLILSDFINVKNLSEINYISPSDIKLLDSYNETEYEFKHSDILDAFNENLPECENKTLVGYKNRLYTHGQSAFIADKIANELTDMKIKYKDFVSLFVPRSELFLLTSLGVLSMGGAYVPIETTYPDERIILMLTDSNSKAVIVSDESEEKISRIISENELNIEILNISHIFKEDIGSLKHLNTADIMGDDVACVLYTSGTTGTPKGSLTPRRSLNNFVSWYVTETNFTSDDVYGMHCSYVFDMHTHALYSPVITGGALYIVPEEIRLDLGSLNEYFVEHNCTHTFITSQVGKLFAESGMDTSIKLLCFGGMKLGELNAPDSIGPFESYGPSENLAISTSIFANKRIHTSSIGRFISNVKGYVLDNQHRRVPIGAVGELYLAGKQLSLGYLNREEVNAKAFFDNPFDDLEGYERIYATGDMVRFLPDGTLSIVGRQDSQVKVRGNRVELPEVESVIRKISFVEDVTVQTTVNNGNNELVAYVVVSDEADENNLRNNIREYVNARKPDYMVPSFVVKLDELPLNVNGKIDKRTLPEVDLSNLGGEYVAPENEVESFLVECYEELLGVTKVSTTDDFFEMGGDSMLVIKIIYKALNKGYTITYADLFDNPTPKSLAKVILSTQQESEDMGNEDYNYDKIDELLAKNNIDSFKKGEYNDGLGDILLTGVTGYLGIHILNELLENEKGNVYCLIRSKKDLTIEDRLNELLNYYFEDDFAKFSGRLHLIEGDITSPDDFKKLKSTNIDTVINSAANVKHFAHGSEIKDINLDGAINCLEFAKGKNARFVQISTVSVAGIRVENMADEVYLHENELYIGQDYISNKYVESKFLAERAVFESAINDNTDVKIMRVGNLMARSYDGKFQINYETNAFMNALKSFVTIGKISESMAQNKMEFSPIDLTAKSIVMLAKTPKDNIVFHPATHQRVTYDELIDVFNELNLNMEIVDDEVFDKSLKEILKDESKQKGMFGLTTVLNNEDVYLPADTEYTLKILSELGFEWPKTNKKYLSMFIKNLINLKFFNI